MGQGGGLRRIRFSSGNWIVGAGVTGAVLYAGCGLRVGGVWPQSCAPPPILAHKNTAPPRPRPVPLGGAVLTQKNIQHFTSIVRVDAWLLFFSMKVNFT